MISSEEVYNAIPKGDLDKVKSFFDQNRDKEQLEDNFGKLEVINLPAENGCRNTKQFIGPGLLCKAIRFDQKLIIEYLLFKKVSPFVQERVFDEVQEEYHLKSTALHVAVERNNLTLVERFLNISDDKLFGVDVLDQDSNTPLHIAAKTGALACGYMLIGQGANPELRNKKNHTVDQIKPHYWPSFRLKYLLLIREVVKAGDIKRIKSLSFTNEQAADALYEAYKCKDDSIIEYLFTQIVDPTYTEYLSDCYSSPALLISLRVRNMEQFETYLKTSKIVNPANLKRMYPILLKEVCKQKNLLGLKLLLNSIEVSNLEESKGVGLFEAILTSSIESPSLRMLKQLISSVRINPSEWKEFLHELKKIEYLICWDPKNPNLWFGGGITEEQKNICSFLEGFRKIEDIKKASMAIVPLKHTSNLPNDISLVKRNYHTEASVQPLRFTRYSAFAVPRFSSGNSQLLKSGLGLVRKVLRK